MGTDDGSLIATVCTRTKEHLARVDRAYHKLFSKSLAQEIKSETSGYYQVKCLPVNSSTAIH
jgi:Annexin